MTSETLDLTIYAPRRATYWEVQAEVRNDLPAAWHAWTCSVAMATWISAVGSPVVEVHIPRSVGQRWYYTFSSGGLLFSSVGLLKEAIPGERITFTEEQNAQTPPTMSAVTFAAADPARTTMTTRVVYISEQERDRSISAGYPDNVITMIRRAARHLDHSDTCVCGATGDEMSSKLRQARLLRRDHGISPERTSVELREDAVRGPAA